MKVLITFLIVFTLMFSMTVSAGESLSTNTAGPTPQWFSTFLEWNGMINLVGDFSATPIFANYTAPPGTNIRVSRLLIAIEDVGITDSDEYGAQPALPRGIQIVHKRNGTIHRLDAGVNISENHDFHRVAFRVDATDDSAQGKDHVIVEWEFSANGVPIRLVGDDGDAIIVIINDNILVDEHFFKIQGYNETTYTLGEGTVNPAEVDMTDFGIVAAIILSTIIFVLYKASVEMDDRHWTLKIGLFYASLAMMWLAVQFAVQVAIDETASANVQSLLATFYVVNIYVGILAFAYLVIKIFWWLFIQAFQRDSQEIDAEVVERRGW